MEASKGGAPMWARIVGGQNFVFFPPATIFFLSSCLGGEEGVFSVIRPNPILHFAPILSTHFFACLNPKFKNGSFLSVVAL